MTMPSSALAYRSRAVRVLVERAFCYLPLRATRLTTRDQIQRSNSSSAADHGAAAMFVRKFSIVLRVSDGMA